MPRAAKTKYELSPEALDDIAAALIYLEAESRKAADKLQSDLIEAFEHLALWPESGHRRGDLTKQSVRFWSTGHYLIVYQVAIRTVQIVAVLHGSRDVPDILAQR